MNWSSSSSIFGKYHNFDAIAVSYWDSLCCLRQELHRYPELSAQESNTATRIIRALQHIFHNNTDHDSGPHSATIASSSSAPLSASLSVPASAPTSGPASSSASLSVSSHISLSSSHCDCAIFSNVGIGHGLFAILTPKPNTNTTMTTTDMCDPLPEDGDSDPHSRLHSHHSGGSGPTVGFRCELDALPIAEVNKDISYVSTTPGVSHKCGHDGHMAIIVGLARVLCERGIGHGRVVLMFQSAEETGYGAKWMLESDEFKHHIGHLDYVFSLHNTPYYPLGQVLCKSGPFSCASRGIIARLHGKPSHASQPENGISPAYAMCDIVRLWTELPKITQFENTYALVTVVHAKLGAVAFGTAPGEAVVMATLRTESNDAMHLLVSQAEACVQSIAERDSLSYEIEYQDVFLAGENDPSCCAMIEESTNDCKIPYRELAKAFRWSEDFGQFCSVANTKGAMFALGSGCLSEEEHGYDTKVCNGNGNGNDEELLRVLQSHGMASPLHAADYDFPDLAIPVGVSVFAQIAHKLNGTAASKGTAH
jgi:amidohydrolase